MFVIGENLRSIVILRTNANKFDMVLTILRRVNASTF